MAGRPFALTAPGEAKEPRPRLKLTSLEPSEADLHANVVRVLEALLAPPAIFWSSGIGAAQLSPQQAARFSRAGIKRGLPDLFILHHKLYGIELKRQTGGVLSKTRIVRTRSGAPRVLIGQVERFAELEAAGAPIAIARSVDEVLAQLAAWGVPLRGRVA